MLLLFATALLDLCALVTDGAALHRVDVALEGLLMVSRHDNRLQDSQRSSGGLACSVFVVFPGTPTFMTLGYDWESQRNSRVSAFATAYRLEAEGKTFRPKRVVVRGTLLRRSDFRWTSPHRANGFGYHGVYPVAILVKSIDGAP